jgi:site-specific recombinase XerD
MIGSYRHTTRDHRRKPRTEDRLRQTQHEADRTRSVRRQDTPFATELANSEVSVYTLMKLLGHESMVTSQRYVTAAGTETRTAAAQNKLYDPLAENRLAD